MAAPLSSISSSTRSYTPPFSSFSFLHLPKDFDKVGIDSREAAFSYFPLLLKLSESDQYSSLQAENLLHDQVFCIWNKKLYALATCAEACKRSITPGIKIEIQESLSLKLNHVDEEGRPLSFKLMLPENPRTRKHIGFELASEETAEKYFFSTYSVIQPFNDLPDSTESERLSFTLLEISDIGLASTLAEDPPFPIFMHFKKKINPASLASSKSSPVTLISDITEKAEGPSYVKPEPRLVVPGAAHEDSRLTLKYATWGAGGTTLSAFKKPISSG